MQFCGGAITLPANRLDVRSQVTLRERFRRGFNKLDRLPPSNIIYFGVKPVKQVKARAVLIVNSGKPCCK